MSSSTKAFRDTFLFHSEAARETQHELTFSVRARNIEALETLLNEHLAHPDSPRYQQWLSFDEVKAMTYDAEASKATKEWLAMHGASVSSESSNGFFIKATASIETWEIMLETKFHVFEDTHPSARSNSDSYKNSNSNSTTSRLYLRARSHTVPSHMEKHIAAIFHASDAPPLATRRGRYYAADGASNIISPVDGFSGGPPYIPAAVGSAPGFVNIAMLASLYGLSSTTVGSQKTNLTIFTTGSSYSLEDLASFQTANGIGQLAPIITNIHGSATTDCVSNECRETSLDLQFASGIAKHVSISIFFSSAADPILDFATSMADMQKPPAGAHT